MNNLIDPLGINSILNDNPYKTQSGQNPSDTNFADMLSAMINEQTQSIMNSMGGMGSMNGMGGIGGIGGMDMIPGINMPSLFTGMENTLVATAEAGEMSGPHLMLFMMIMMMQTSDSGGELAPIMQIIANMLQKSVSDNTVSPAPKQQMQFNILPAEDTDPTVKRMVDIALSQVGTQERNRDGSVGNGNFTKYGAWYGMDGQPWCAMFVSWAANEAGALHDIVPKHASTAKGVAAYQERGLYAKNNSGYQPKEGDAIYFRNSSGRICHVGIVVAFDPQTQRVYTVEGNTNNAVRIRHYDMNNPRIDGFGRNGGTSNGTVPINSSAGSGANTR